MTVAASPLPSPAGGARDDVRLDHRADVTDLLWATAARRPAAPAVTDPDGRWSYADLAAAAESCAAWLAGLGVRPGDRVVGRVGNVREFLALLFGTLRRGAVFVPVNPEVRPYLLRGVLADAEPRLVVSVDADLPSVAALTPVPVRPLTELRRVVAGGPAAPSAAGPSGADDPDRIALLIYTSGSTAAPKAVVSPHRTVLFATRAVGARLAYRSDDVVLVAVPLAFDYGLYQIFLALAAGAHLVLADPALHVRLVTTIAQHGVSVVPVVPSLAETLVRLADRHVRRHGAAPPVRLFTNTGAALTPGHAAGLRRAFPGAAVVPMFGTTECKRITIAEPDGDLTRPGSVGRALDGTEVLVLDDDGHPLPAGHTGEIVVRGPHVMAGYWRAPELTARRFRPDPVTGTVTLHTGDYGRLDSDGHLYFEGRRDDLFKRRGLRVSALEIEAAACDVPGVTAAAVLPPADGRDAELAVVGTVPADEVLHELAGRLEDGKVPPVCHVLRELPLTANGKTDKRRLAELIRRPAPEGEKTR
ncbi:AMP-binding protein [Micromonospora sp. NPDC050980]|uniref:class I adenylate-forming enzyme family protein n=1 Tax=Micromonospora sp. NPDC050980 TaxID=3155161 RepID=UPI0033C5214A